jgi:hypothetical protein
VRHSLIMHNTMHRVSDIFKHVPRHQQLSNIASHLVLFQLVMLNQLKDLEQSSVNMCK